MKKKTAFLPFFILLEIALFAGGIFLYIQSPDLMIASIILGVLALILLISLISKYNKIIRYSNKVKESFALIDIHLKLRFDLIPNLVAVVKKYSQHEKETLEEITKIRKLATEATDNKEKIEYANKLVPQMKNLIAIAESYPDIKADTLYKSLMEQLVDAEDRIASARRIYDSNVNQYNTLIEVFPSNLVARGFGFDRQELFRIDVGENILPQVNMEEVWYQKKIFIKNAEKCYQKKK